VSRSCCDSFQCLCFTVCFYTSWPLDRTTVALVQHSYQTYRQRHSALSSMDHKHVRHSDPCSRTEPTWLLRYSTCQSVLLTVLSETIITISFAIAEISWPYQWLVKNPLQSIIYLLSAQMHCIAHRSPWDPVAWPGLWAGMKLTWVTDRWKSDPSSCALT